MEQEKIPKNFGIPEVDNTPMGLVQMEGNFYRGMGLRGIKSLWLRIAGIIFALMFFILPSGLGIYALLTGSFMGEENTPSVIWLLQMLFVLIFLFVGIKIIYNLGIKRSKNNQD